MLLQLRGSCRLRVVIGQTPRPITGRRGSEKRGKPKVCSSSNNKTTTTTTRRPVMQIPASGQDTRIMLLPQPLAARAAFRILGAAQGIFQKARPFRAAEKDEGLATRQRMSIDRGTRPAGQPPEPHSSPRACDGTTPSPRLHFTFGGRENLPPRAGSERETAEQRPATSDPGPRICGSSRRRPPPRSQLRSIPAVDPEIEPQSIESAVQTSCLPQVCQSTLGVLLSDPASRRPRRSRVERGRTQCSTDTAWPRARWGRSRASWAR